ncbi:MAG: ribonuclease Z [Nanoarchaeota archaeon]|nr:ribonuclease Z [Nanoarchaeota archaeon]
MEITFLGTACMQPTKERNHSGILLDFGPEHMLFDCGEGIQRQFKVADIRMTKLTKIFLTHWHGDHSLGIMGLLQTLSASDISQKITIYGPKGTKENLEMLTKIYRTNNVPDYEVVELENGKIIDADSYYVETLRMDHGIESFGFRFVEKDKRKMNMEKLNKLGIKEGPLVGKLQAGKEITVKGKKVKPEEVSTLMKGKIFVYLSDTGLCQNAYKLSEDADILVTEATFDNELTDKAERYKHLTAEQAGQIASMSNSKKLIITHFSQRYKTLDDLEKETKDVFPNAVLAFDFMKIKI